jgi:hypothetical protein
VAGGQGRTSAALAVAGRVWAPDFYRVAGRTGRRNTMRLGLSRWPARGIRLSRGTMTRLFLYMRCILSIYARGGVLILPCLKVSRCRYLVPQTRRLFSVGELQAPGTQARRVPRYPVPGYFGWPGAREANQNLIRNDDQQRAQQRPSSRRALCPPSLSSRSQVQAFLLLASLQQQLGPSNRGIN